MHARGARRILGREATAQAAHDAVRSKSNPRLPGFASSMPRMAGSGSQSERGSRNRSPAPGEYDPAAGEDVAQRSRRTFNTHASDGRAKFNSEMTRARVKTPGGSEGDPGAYIGPFGDPGVNQGKKETLAAKAGRSFNRDVNQGRGSLKPQRTIVVAVASLCKGRAR